jgi:putative endonuclease
MNILKKGDNRKSLGTWGEDCACSFLTNQGFSIVARNIRSPYGEIDILAQKENLLVFVEVKTRSNTVNGYPEAAITEMKIKHMEESIQWYLDQHADIKDNWRVDVISVIGKPASKQLPKIDWWQNEF